MTVQQILRESGERRKRRGIEIAVVALLVVSFFGWGQYQVRSLQQQNRQLNITMQKTADALEECGTPGGPGNVHECYDTARRQDARALASIAALIDHGHAAIRCLLLQEPADRTPTTIRNCERQTR